MKRFLFFATTMACCFVYINIFCQKNEKYSDKDLENLGQLPIKWESYWNTHNMDAMGNLLKDDVDFINVAGIWLKGKTQTVKDHKIKHQGITFKTSIWKTDSVAIKYVKPDVAIIHIKWEISGDFESNGTPRPPRHGTFTWVVIKENERWLLVAAQNTNLKSSIP